MIKEITSLAFARMAAVPPTPNVLALTGRRPAGSAFSAALCDLQADRQFVLCCLSLSVQPVGEAARSILREGGFPANSLRWPGCTRLRSAWPFANSSTGAGRTWRPVSAVLWRAIGKAVRSMSILLRAVPLHDKRRGHGR